MIIVNVYYEEDYNPETDGFNLNLVGIVNDELDLYYDIELITDCVENDTNFEPKAGQFYELELIRTTISSDPLPESAFAIHKVNKMIYDVECGWINEIKLKREDLSKLKKDLPFQEVTLYDFKQSSISTQEIYKAERIIFSDNEKVRVLKNRYGYES